MLSSYESEHCPVAAYDTTVIECLTISRAHTADVSCEVSFIACETTSCPRGKCSFVSTRQHKAPPVCLPTLFFNCSLSQKACATASYSTAKIACLLSASIVTASYTTYHSSVCLSNLQIQHSAADCRLFFPHNIPNVINLLWCWLSWPLSLLLCRHQATCNDDTNPQEVFQILLAAVDHDAVLI